MKNLAFGALLVGLLVACGGGDDNKNTKIMPLDSGTVDTPTQCNPLTQAGCAAGEKCTWFVDAVMPQYVGHIGCAPDGTAAVGATCMYGAAGVTGYDDCAKGNVCTAFGNPANPGVCKQLCDQQGGAPMCDADHVCVTYADLFDVGENTPAAAGVCDQACDPLADNDFDGSGTKVKTGTTCGSAEDVGCYGSPSDTPPATGWSCTGDFNFENGAGVGLRHRVVCNDANMCSRNGTRYLNSCNQGYLPLMYETSAQTAVICVALCKPADCSTGACGANNVARKGVAGDACTTNDRVGASFTTNATVNSTAPGVDPVDTGGEHCMYSWLFEIDANDQILTSPTSDTVGFCYDHSKYQYDADNNGTDDTALPNCGLLAISGTHRDTDLTNPLVYFGAADFGCVSTALLPAANGKLPAGMLKARAKLDLPRPMYHRVMR